MRLQPGTVRRHAAPERRLAAGVLPLMRLVLHGGSGPLADGLALPLADRGKNVEDQAPRGAAGVDLLSNGKQRCLPGAK